MKLPPARGLAIDVTKLPMKLGDWQGEDKELDPKTFDRTAADVAVNREYRDNEGHVVTVLLALYRTDPDAGVYHAPTNCYRSNGWRLTDESTTERVPLSKTASQRVHLTTWEKQNDTILVMFPVSDGRLHPLRPLGLVVGLLAMRGRELTPPMVKILLQTQTPHHNEFYSKARIQEMAARIQRWLNQSNAEDKPQIAGK